jgi:hypothetical protein
MSNYLSTSAAMLAALGSPNMLVHRLEPVRRQARVVRIQRSTYHVSSFLDERALTPNATGAWFNADSLRGALVHAPPSKPLHLILHTGHVGSTLLSRLLDELGGTLPIREPLPLRTLADAADQLAGDDALLLPAEYADWLDLFVMLWSRGYPDTACCVLKATSSAARLAPSLLAHVPAMNACYLHLGAEPYLATMLAGERSWLDLRGHSQERYRRLRRGGFMPPQPLATLTTGELAALAWLSEAMTRHSLQSRFVERVLFLDFEQLLNDVPAALMQVAAHFAVPCDRSSATRVVQGGVMQRYAKAPEHTYSPAIRAQRLASARVDQAKEIGAGLRWIEKMCDKYSALAIAVGIAGR